MHTPFKQPAFILLVVVTLTIGCSTGRSTTADGGDATGGLTSSGSAASGSSSDRGGTRATGGSSGGGGITATGGRVATGGTVVVAGGASGTGGATTGRTSAETGGQTMSTGGRQDSGGQSAFGGASSGSGGTVATGGRAGAPGGASGTGGNRDAGPDGRAEVGGGSDVVSGGDAGLPKITVWLAGDSTVQSCSSPCPCGWGSQFQPLLNANATVVNSAVGGRSVQTWLYDPNVTTSMANGECVVNPKTYSKRWQDMLDGMKAGDYLLIEFGINDGDATCNRHVGGTLFQSYLGVMADAAQARGAQAIFLTSTSYIECSGSTAKTNRGFGPETKAAGTAARVPVIDLTALSAALYTRIGLCPNDSIYTSTTSAVGKFFCEDHTHFESTGAKEIAGVVAKALRDQGIGLAAYLK